jgi:predicted Ser/Thr protein kinase
MGQDPELPGSPGPPERSRHERVKQIFMDALDVPRARRAAFVAVACAGDEAVQREILELFLLHGEPDPVLDAPLDGAGALAGLAEPRGATIGPFRLVRKLGEGGMGVVYLAERDGHRVAIKLLAAGAVSPELRERFRLEAEILARLHHAGIARIVDVGDVQEQGGLPQPWIAMEYVEGHSLHEYAEYAHLELDGRLELLAAICDAVQHAHSQGIVHRDLKPANILVRADGRPVVLDFGVARLTGGDERPTELLTHTGQLIGTPQYMSPEQVQAEPAGITPASDVYSLGVIAYELCAGRLPYEASSVSLHRAIWIILSVEPPALGKLDRRYRGALERVVSKALEKRTGDRYPNAGEFAGDLRRYLQHRPVRARGPSLWRRLSRSTRTQRRVIAAAISLLVAGLVVGTWFVATRRPAVPRERVLAAYRDAETLTMQAIPLLYEGERTPSRMRQAIDLYARARLEIEQVPPLRTHHRLMRVIEKDLGTAQFLLGELTWDLQPYRASAQTLEHAVTLLPDTSVGWQQDIRYWQLQNVEVPQRDLYGLLTSAYLGQYRLWGESNSLLNAQLWMRASRREIGRVLGGPRSTDGAPEGPSRNAWAYFFNSLAEVTTEAARFRADTSLAGSAVLFSDSALARRGTFLQNWPALGSLLFERGRAFRTVGALTASRAAFDSSARYLHASADYRGPERPWVFAQTRQELASLALDRARLERVPSRREALLHMARRDVDTALRVLKPTELPPAASASLRSLDAELLAELAMASRRPALLEEAESQLHEASLAFPSTALPREAAWVCVRRAVLARARFGLAGDHDQLDSGEAALDRAQLLMESHADSLVMFRIRHERAELTRTREAARR